MMASIARDPGGRRRIQFTAADGRRKTIRLGQVPMKDAESFRLRIEKILTSQTCGTAIDGETARWLAQLPDAVYQKLVNVGLVPPRVAAQRTTLGALLEAFFANQDVKPSTMTRMRQAESALVNHFTADRDIDTISETDADAWRADLRSRYAAATVSRTVLYARQIFRWGMRRGVVTTNPFAELKAGPQTNAARTVFIDRETIAKVIDAAPDAEWRLLIALSRFGGLRVPSEALALRWSDVDWANNGLTVRSSKTEHHEGRAERIVPIFPEIRGHLMAVYDQAPEGAVWVVTRYREGCNLNPQLRRIIGHAGLTPWPRTWHNLRASRQTELATTYPLHTVCAWIGNTKAIAAGHYLQVTDADWARATGAGEGGAESGARAAQNPAQHQTAHDRSVSQETSHVVVETGFTRDRASPCDYPHKPLMGRGGLEPPTPAFSVPCSTN
jgi:integrase